MDEEFLLGEQLLCPRVSAITAEASMLFGMLNSFQYVAPPSTWLVPQFLLRFARVSGPAKQVCGQLHMMHDCIVHLLGSRLSDSTVYALQSATRALLEITA